MKTYNYKTSALRAGERESLKRKTFRFTVASIKGLGKFYLLLTDEDTKSFDEMCEKKHVRQADISEIVRFTYNSSA